MLEAMEKLLARGARFSSVSIEHLAETAGIARATFYLHFRDKGELVTRLLDQVRHEIVESAGLWFQKPALVEYDDLRATVRGILGVYAQHHVIINAVAQTAQQDATVAALHREVLDELCGESRRALEALHAAGRANALASPQVADMLTVGIDHCGTIYGAKLKGAKLEQLTDTWTLISWNAMFREAR